MVEIFALSSKILRLILVDVRFLIPIIVRCLLWRKHCRLDRLERLEDASSYSDCNMPSLSQYTVLI